MTKRYQINTLLDMAAIPAEHVAAFCEELPSILAAIREARDSVPVGQTVVPAGATWWYADGRHYGTINVRQSDGTINVRLYGKEHPDND